MAKKRSSRKPMWERPNAKNAHTKLSPAKKAKAKRRAKKAGRRYPNMVDNARVAREG
jgi:hypothetical protein